MELDSAISFQPFNKKRNGSVRCTPARSLAVRPAAWNWGIPAMNLSIGWRDDVHRGRSTMKQVPTARAR